jgi:peptide/nickel transport system substrate-binding protein
MEIDGLEGRESAMVDRDLISTSGPVETGRGRRDFLKLAAGATGIALGGALLDACSSSASPSTSGTRTTAAKRGGTLRVGLTGGGSDDSLNPNLTITIPAFAGLAMLYDCLISLDDHMVPHYALATEVSPNSDATVWTIRLRDGVTFHNGKDLTADDLAFTFNWIVKGNSVSPPSLEAKLLPIDLASMKKLDRLTLQVPCTRPWSMMSQVLPANFTFPVLPEGFDPKHPVGTGPFKLVSFTPGVQLTTERNPDYWITGLPYLDGVRITEYTDETSQVNAMLSGVEDAMGAISGASLPSVEQDSNLKAIISKTGGWNPICMRMDVPPFNDVRVRQAMRLLVDRQQMLDLVFYGHGLVANDLFGIFDPVYDRSIPQRVQDVPQAKFLLKQAGQEGLNVTLTTAAVAAGAIQQCEVFAQQASAGGVHVSLQTIPTSQLYGPEYLSWHFSVDTWAYTFYFPQARFSNVYPPILNECHFSIPAYTALFNEAMRTVEFNKLAELAHEMQTIEWNQGGYIIPINYPIIDVVSKRVFGAQPSEVGQSFNFFQQFKTMWFD